MTTSARDRSGEFRGVAQAGSPCMLDSGPRRAGVVECVGIAIMVGLAVDYVVHMATCLAHCPAHGRDGVTFALRTMAMSVMSGAVTTIGAALFLLPCEMAAFQQFGAPPTRCRAAPAWRLEPGGPGPVQPPGAACRRTHSPG